jgi:hypothetical protein
MGMLPKGYQPDPKVNDLGFAAGKVNGMLPKVTNPVSGTGSPG